MCDEDERVRESAREYKRVQESTRVQESAPVVEEGESLSFTAVSSFKTPWTQHCDSGELIIWSHII